MNRFNVPAAMSEDSCYLLQTTWLWQIWPQRCKQDTTNHLCSAFLSHEQNFSVIIQVLIVHVGNVVWLIWFYWASASRLDAKKVLKEASLWFHHNNSHCQDVFCIQKCVIMASVCSGEEKIPFFQWIDETTLSMNIGMNEDFLYW